jgi:hypothetical protein
MRVPHHSLKLLAAATWYIGGGVLAYRGTGYLVGAARAGSLWPPLVAAAAGLGIGLVRGRTLFLGACQRNLRRIDGLTEPRLWQFFRPWFFAALVVMMAVGGVLAWLATRGYWGAMLVGGAELALATALLTSSVVFWTGESGVGSRAESVDVG